MIELVKDLRALPGLVGRLIDAIESIADAIDDVLDRANVEQRAREREQAQTATLEATRAVCPMCGLEWRAVSPARVALVEWTHANRMDFVIVVSHGNAQHIVHNSTCTNRPTARSVPWSHAGGPNECPHGYAEGVPCPACLSDGKLCANCGASPCLGSCVFRDTRNR